MPSRGAFLLPFMKESRFFLHNSGFHSDFSKKRDENQSSASIVAGSGKRDWNEVAFEKYERKGEDQQRGEWRLRQWWRQRQRRSDGGADETKLT